MTEHVKRLYDILCAREYRKARNQETYEIDSEMVSFNPTQKSTHRLIRVLDREQPVLHPNENVGFNRYAAFIPSYDTGSKWHSDWGLGNLTPNYSRVMSLGFDVILADLAEKRETADDEQKEFIDCLTAIMQACLRLADRYCEAAKVNHPALYQALKQVPHGKATNFHEACVFMKFICYTLRCGVCPHVTIGRFDQYMYPYYQHDLSMGKTKEELFDLLEEFFISMNFDTDLYQGVQLGDNGLSMVLGGYDTVGNDYYNELSELCIKASLELNLIDPKINLRVNSTTPFDRYLLGTQLTKRGMGFPQYCNDDVVIPALIALGYDEEDAIDYVVAACWEFIIPGKGAEVPNLITMNFPKVVEKVTAEHLKDSSTFDEFMSHVIEELKHECAMLQEEAEQIIHDRNQYYSAPYLSMYIDGCYEACRGIEKGTAKYNGIGCHGAGIAVAADALMAIKTVIYDEKSVTVEQLMRALEENFENDEPLRHRLLDCPKMGNNHDDVDQIACVLMDTFSKHMNGIPTSGKGVFRAGTGSAHEYILSAAKVGATADGRKAGQPYGSSFSPSLTTRLDGPLSVIQSFTKYDLKKICNGGPLTMEIHDTVFRNEDGVSKVALLVQNFIRLGGHQLQLNAVNRERLLDAQKHPEDYPSLIVRVWGWSGYFNELSKEFQDHIIRRTEFVV